jgi:hypothetical protein
MTGNSLGVAIRFVDRRLVPIDANHIFSNGFKGVVVADDEELLEAFEVAQGFGELQAA